MPTITNKTKKPIKVPLPGGKKLYLSPGKEAQIGPKAVDHPAVQKLVEAGDVEIEGQDKRGASGTGGQGGPSGPQRSSSGGIRHVGDR